VVYDTRNYWGSELCPSPGILNTRKPLKDGYIPGPDRLYPHRQKMALTTPKSGGRAIGRAACELKATQLLTCKRFDTKHRASRFGAASQWDKCPFCIRGERSVIMGYTAGIGIARVMRTEPSNRCSHRHADHSEDEPCVMSLGSALSCDHPL
jgi:hypothetical protein